MGWERTSYCLGGGYAEKRGQAKDERHLDVGLMILHEYDIDAGTPLKVPPPEKCIYCSERPVAGETFTDEHVIPFALGKNAIVYEKACCSACQDIIKPYEGRVLERQLRVIRDIVSSPTRRRSRDRATSVRLTIAECGADGTLLRDLETKELPLADAPLILPLWESPPPLWLPPLETALRNPAPRGGRSWTYVESKVAEPLIAEAARRYGVERAALRTYEVQRLDYLRWLAKTAHAFVACQLGPDGFESFLTDIVLDRSDVLEHVVGDQAGIADLEGATGHDFKITLGGLSARPGAPPGLICVFMQLWGDVGSPAHIVVAGRPRIDVDAEYERRRSQAVR